MAKFIKEYESFIISGKREETLQGIIPNTESDLYIKIINQLNNLDSNKEYPLEVLFF